MANLFRALTEWFQNSLTILSQAVPKQPVITAFNNSSLTDAEKAVIAKNAGAIDFQDIASAKVTLPVIHAGVLSYKPGELGSNTEIGRKGGNVYYSTDSISDPEFLETVMRSPFSVGTHEKNTVEGNRDVDGYPIRAWYDENTQTTYVEGFVLGEANVEYVKKNKSTPGFGTSAYIKFIGFDNTPGVAPDGSAFDGKTTKLANSHLAILDNIRDKKHNGIVAINSLPDESGEEAGGKMADIKNEDIRNAIDAYMSEREESEKAKAINERLDKIEAAMAGKQAEEPKKEEVKNEDAPGTEKEPPKEGENAEDEDAFNAKNAIPSEDVIKDASAILRTTYRTAPSWSALGAAFGLDVKGKKTAEVISAVNAHIDEAKNKKPVAKNAETKSKFAGVLEEMI